eukprot:4311529-Prymnesium_polylepis.1
MHLWLTQHQRSAGREQSEWRRDPDSRGLKTNAVAVGPTWDAPGSPLSPIIGGVQRSTAPSIE